eukprot:313079_1
MTAFVETSYYYYISLLLWSFMTFIILCIFVIELWTYFYKLCLHHKIQIIQSNSSETCSKETIPPSSPSIKSTQSNISGKKTHYLKPNYLFPILSYLFYLLTSITGLLFPSSNKNICYWSTRIGTISYSMGKMFMYLVFIYRLHDVFKNSFYEYNW